MTYTPPPVPAAAAPKAGGLAIAALIVGIAAFVFGLVPFLGILIALVGIVLGVIALTKPGPKLLPAIGVSLAGVAALTNVVVILVVFLIAPPSLWDRGGDTSSDYSARDDDEDDEAEQQDPLELNLTSFSTPCFTFDVPEEFISNQSADDDALCLATREGWGELNEDGTVTYTGVGAIWDQVLVEPVRVTSTDSWVPDGELDSMVDYLEANYYPQLGDVITLREAYELDGAEANLTRFDSPSDTTVTKATLVVKAPQPYETANGAVQFFLITVVVVDERGDLIIDALVDSWRWE